VLAASYLGNAEIVIVPTEPEPPGPEQVQVEVAYVGICGTDLHVLNGEMDSRVTRPAILGHEMSGVVAALGEGVTGWSPGDRVTVVPLTWDGTCPACRAGHEHVCHRLQVNGVEAPGALQRLWNVRADQLVVLPRDLRLDHAALVEPTAVAVHDVRRAELVAGQRAVVLGGGPIGVLIAAVARHEGAEVVVVEIDAHRRRYIETMGFDVLDPSAVDLSSWVDDWTGGAGADVVFEVAGTAAAVLAATDLVRVRGTVVVVAIHPVPRRADLHRVFLRELRLLGARVHERRDFERAVELLAAGTIPAEGLITRIVPLAETAAAFAAQASGQEMKVLIDLTGPSAAEAAAAGPGVHLQRWS
jgi:(R,R)-butanediol dehydrogenase / meso-butanediol dehydrogenase / diacetyl reductase